MKPHCSRIRTAQYIVIALLSVSLSALGESHNKSSAGQLLEQFKSTKVFWQQFEIAKELVALHDASVLPELAGWLNHEDRHLRGNVAFVFAGLGDDRGFKVIQAILADRSDRPEGQGIPTAPGNGRYHVGGQIKADRYYAVHLFGDLKDSRAVPILVPLLSDARNQFHASSPVYKKTGKLAMFNGST